MQIGITRKSYFIELFLIKIKGKQNRKIVHSKKEPMNIRTGFELSNFPDNTTESFRTEKVPLKTI
jgi:hypothetical protein